MLDKFKFWGDFKSSSAQIPFVTINNYRAIRVHKETGNYGICSLLIQVKAPADELVVIIGVKLYFYPKD
ncbi:hypothetical protein ES703_02579 [subsurface metagenome]